MTFKEMERAALGLSDKSRADLAQSLLQSLGETAEDSAHYRVWAAEAAQRYQDLRDNPGSVIAAEEVFSKLRAAT